MRYTLYRKEDYYVKYNIDKPPFSTQNGGGSMVYIVLAIIALNILVPLIKGAFKQNIKRLRVKASLFKGLEIDTDFYEPKK